MCDEFTGTADETTGSLTRRQFATAGTAAAIAAYATPALAAGSLSENMVDVTTPDGKCDAFFVHPAKGKHPGVIMWPDALGLRDANKAMARRLAGDGYSVLIVNPYYRLLRGAVGLDFSAFRTPEGRQKITPLMGSLTPADIAKDAAAFVAFLDAQPSVDTKRGIGAQGYCFSGAFAIRAAATVPERIKAVATFHGGGLVNDKPESPHLSIAKTKASFLIAIAKDDDAKQPDAKDVLKATAAAAGRPAEIEVYKGDHSWTVPDAPVYDKAEGDRAWARLLALYAKL
ncbi:dienelactone hydrolase family protein [Sphingomonas immobilis]|uniref:Dienelactone hydrolase family protein n=1 Tax=Sphingomonas immobilis TaxID=3063997 RepID=A0ABT8ZYC3_9SPHN|nr:dienelactone hydrolase family protein [Sphingomonas sp. CA1-15]MDO7842575.1 dienelactone hydrolase family protein [Sphingomonas sp. CA1-15]